MRKLPRWWGELTALERMLLRRAMAASIVARIALVVLPWKRLAERKPPAAGPALTAPAAVALVRWAIGVCARRAPFQTCLSSGGMTIRGERPMTVLASFASS
jgi:hypothetical protein